MRMMPSIFGEDLFDEWMDFPFEKEFFGRKNPLYGKNEKNLMKTDVKETDESFEVDIDLPGFKKENVSARLENGYLTIQAVKGLDKDEEDKERQIISGRERYTGKLFQEASTLARVLPRMRSVSKFEDGILSSHRSEKRKKAGRREQIYLH